MGRGEVGFQVPVGVPAEGADAVAESDAQFAERVAQPRSALEQIGVGVAMRPVVDAGNDLLFGELDGRAFEDAVRQQFVLHRHRETPWGKCRSGYGRSPGYGCLMLTPPSIAHVWPVT